MTQVIFLCHNFMYFGFSNSNLIIVVLFVPAKNKPKLSSQENKAFLSNHFDMTSSNNTTFCSTNEKLYMCLRMVVFELPIMQNLTIFYDEQYLTLPKMIWGANVIGCFLFLHHVVTYLCGELNMWLQLFPTCTTCDSGKSLELQSSKNYQEHTIGELHAYCIFLKYNHERRQSI